MRAFASDVPTEERDRASTVAMWATNRGCPAGDVAAPRIDAGIVGVTVDAALGKRALNVDACCSFSQEHREACECLSTESILATWKSPSRLRVAVAALFVAAAFAIGLGWLGPVSWNWKRITLIFVVAVGLFVVVSVPEAFLRKHLVGHVLGRHAPKIFAWTAGTVLNTLALKGRLDDGRAYVLWHQLDQAQAAVPPTGILTQLICEVS